MVLFVFLFYLFLTAVAHGPFWPHLFGNQLDVRYAGTTWMVPGMSLDIQDTTLAPEIGTTGLQCDKKYILIFIDLDAILPGTKVQSIILHWYQSHLLVDCTNPHHPSLIVPGKSHEDRGPLAASYIAPRAPPHTRHRYVFLLFAQPSEYLFPDCFAHVFPETPSARSGFDIRRFTQAAGLDMPLAMNFFIGCHEPTDGGPTTVVRATTTSFRSVNCPTSATRSLYEANHTW